MTPMKLLTASALLLALGTAPLAFARESSDAPPPPPPGHDDNGPGGPGGPGPQGWHHSNELMELLPDDKRKLLKDAMEKSHAENKSLWEQGKKLHEERDALLKAPKFDQEAFLKKSAEIDALHDKMAQSREKTIASVAAQFSPQERRVLLVMEHMMREHMHGAGEWAHRPGHGPASPPERGDPHQPS